MVEPWIVIPVVVGSSPILHPMNAKIAQLVEHRSEESGVVGSIPTLGTKQMPCWTNW